MLADDAADLAEQQGLVGRPGQRLVALGHGEERAVEPAELRGALADPLLQLVVQPVVPCFALLQGGGSLLGDPAEGRGHPHQDQDEDHLGQRGLDGLLAGCAGDPQVGLDDDGSSDHERDGRGPDARLRGSAEQDHGETDQREPPDGGAHPVGDRGQERQRRHDGGAVSCPGRALLRV